jgi:hypothetical protein
VIVTGSVVGPKRVAAGFGAYPENIRGGGCLPWKQGYSLNDGYIIDENGNDTGLPECQPEGFYSTARQVPVVLWVPPELMMALAQAQSQSEIVRAGADALQERFRTAQGLTRWSDAAAFMALRSGAEDLAPIAAAAAAADDAWHTFKAADDAAENGYTTGTYQDPNQGAQVMAAFQAYNNMPISLANAQAASDALDELFQSNLTDALTDWNNLYTQTAKATATVSAAFSGVDDLVNELALRSQGVPLPDDARDAIGSVGQKIEDLKALAAQIGSIYVSIKMRNDQVDTAYQNGDLATIYPAVVWLRDEAQPPFIGAGERATALADDIHARLDPLLAALHAYLTQHPEIAQQQDAAAAKAKDDAGKIFGMKKGTAIMVGGSLAIGLLGLIRRRAA